jgi:hypothetical protein
VRGHELAEAYTREKYHQPADKFDPDWDTGNVLKDMALLYALGRQIADDRIWPNWSPDSEFFALREMTKADRK